MRKRFELPLYLRAHGSRVLQLQGAQFSPEYILIFHYCYEYIAVLLNTNQIYYLKKNQSFESTLRLHSYIFSGFKAIIHIKMEQLVHAQAIWVLIVVINHSPLSIKHTEPLEEGRRGSV